jgi:hypothetical protein
MDQSRRQDKLLVPRGRRQPHRRPRLDRFSPHAGAGPGPARGRVRGNDASAAQARNRPPLIPNLPASLRYFFEKCYPEYDLTGVPGGGSEFVDSGEAGVKKLRIDD